MRNNSLKLDKIEIYIIYPLIYNITKKMDASFVYPMTEDDKYYMMYIKSRFTDINDFFIDFFKPKPDVKFYQLRDYIKFLTNLKEDYTKKSMSDKYWIKDPRGFTYIKQSSELKSLHNKIKTLDVLIKQNQIEIKHDKFIEKEIKQKKKKSKAHELSEKLDREEMTDEKYADFLAYQEILKMEEYAVRHENKYKTVLTELLEYTIPMIEAREHFRKTTGYTMNPKLIELDKKIIRYF